MALPGVAGVVGDDDSVALPVPNFRKNPSPTGLVIGLISFGESGVGDAIDGAGVCPSDTGDTTFFSDLLRVKIPRRPPFDSLRRTFRPLKGTLLSSELLVFIGGGRTRRLGAMDDDDDSSLPMLSPIALFPTFIDIVENFQAPYIIYMALETRSLDRDSESSIEPSFKFSQISRFPGLKGSTVSS